MVMRFVFWMGLLLGSGLPLIAQTVPPAFEANVVVTVRDTSGAVIPEAQILISQGEPVRRCMNAERQR